MCSPATKSRKNVRQVVAIEAVETRQMMAGSNIYNIAGTPGNDQIRVYYTETSSGDYMSVRVNDQKWEKLNPSVASISISGLGGNDSITWDDNRKVFRATFPVGISGGTGDDKIIFGSEGRYDPYFLRYTYMNITGDAGTDRIVMDSSLRSSITAGRTEISADYISPEGAVGSNYYGIEQIDIKAAATKLDLHVKSLGATTAVNVLNNAQGSKLTVGNGDLDNMKGIVNFNGVSGNDTVVVDDSKDTGGRTYTLESTKITLSTGGFVFLNNSDAVSLLGTQGSGTYRVKSTGIGRSLSITPGKGTDLLDVGGGNYSANIKAPVTFFDDTANTGSVVISDTGSTLADTINLSGGQFSKAGAPATTWAYARKVTLAASNGANAIKVTPSATVSFMIDGNSQALGTGDSLALQLAADEIAVLAGNRLTGQYLFANKKPITFQEIEDAQGSTNLPTVSVDDRVAMEGNSGDNILTFTVTLSKPMFLPVSVQFDTLDNTAQVDADFAGVSRIVTFAPGETKKEVQVTIFGDTVVESDESFFVKLSNATGATLAKELGIAALINDDVQLA